MLANFVVVILMGMLPYLNVDLYLLNDAVSQVLFRLETSVSCPLTLFQTTFRTSFLLLSSNAVQRKADDEDGLVQLQFPIPFV